MSEMRNPRLCEILGVEVEERFGIGEIECDFWINEKGDACSELYNLRTSAMWTLKAINNPSLITHKTCLTEQELDICRAIGAKWVTYDNECEGVSLWENRSVRDENVAYIGEKVLAVVDKSLFPSLIAGDCIKIQ